MPTGFSPRLAPPSVQAAANPIAAARHHGQPWQESLAGAGFLSVLVALLVLWSLRARGVAVNNACGRQRIKQASFLTDCGGPSSMAYGRSEMCGLRDVLKQAEKDRVAIGHFNTSDLVQLKAVFGAAQELKV
jgi:hypothetical protein